MDGGRKEERKEGRKEGRSERMKERTKERTKTIFTVETYYRKKVQYIKSIFKTLNLISISVFCVLPGNC